MQRQFCSNLEYFGLFLITAIGTFIFIIFTLPLSLFRKLLIWFVKVYNKEEFVDILDSHSTLFADGGFVQPFNIVAVLEMSGKLTAENITNVIETSVLSGNRYLQLKYYPENYFCYWFWKKDENFQVKNHVTVIKKIVDSQNNAFVLSREAIHERMLDIAFPEKRSPWDVTIFSNEDNTQCSTFLAIRIHHCLGDGKSLVKLIVEGVGNKTLNTSRERNIDRKITAWQYVLMPLYLVRTSMEAILTRKCAPNHPWRVIPDQNNSSPMIVRFSSEINLDKIKHTISKVNNKPVCTSAMLIATVTSAIKRFCENNYLCCDPVPMVLSLPKPNHPDTMKNHFFLGMFEPTKTVMFSADPYTECQNMYTGLRQNHIQNLCREILLYLTTSLPGIIRKKLPLFDTFVTGLTNIAGENEEFSVADEKCSDFSLSAGFGRSSMGVRFVSFSYKRKIKFLLISRRNVLDEDRMAQLVSFLDQEIFKLI